LGRVGVGSIYDPVNLEFEFKWRHLVAANEACAGNFEASLSLLVLATATTMFFSQNFR